MFRIVLIIVVLLQSTFPALADDDFEVGFRKIEVIAEETNERFPVTVVYPTNTPAKNIRFGLFEMKLSMYGEIAEGKFPMAIISHGSGGSDIGHRSIAFALVKQGFIVGMPLHPKDNYKDNAAAGTVSNWINRPKHIESTWMPYCQIQNYRQA